MPKILFNTFEPKKIMCTNVSFLPSIFDVFVDAPSDGHGNNGIIPGADEHESKAQAHSQEG